MIDNPSYNGIGSYSRTVLRTTRKEAEDRVTTQRSTASTPSPRGHALELCLFIKTLNFIQIIFLL